MKIGNLPPPQPFHPPVTKHRRNIDGSNNRNNHNRARARANLNMNPSANNVIARAGRDCRRGLYVPYLPHRSAPARVLANCPGLLVS